MKFLDALLGRTKPKPADLDALFAVPAAAITLEATLRIRPAGAGAVSYKPATGGGFAATRDEIGELLTLAAKEQAAEISTTSDSYGYEWVVVRDPDVADLATTVHMVTSMLAERGFTPQLLASVFAFTTDEGKPVHLVYLIKRGTFYPFAPSGDQQRDTALELSVRGTLEQEGGIRIEPELSRWFPIWGVPVP